MSYMYICIVFISFYVAGPTSQQDEANPLF